MAKSAVTKRWLLSSLVGSSCFFLFNEEARARGECNLLSPVLEDCTVGISSALIERVAQRQYASEWCWAASISMVFAYYGHDVSQEQIVQKTWGRITNMPGQPGQIIADLNKSWTDDAGESFEVRGDVVTANVVTAAQDLNEDHPLLIGALGHCMVLTALRYLLNVAGQGQIELATVRDPWPFNPGERYLSPGEWFGANFLARIRVG